MKNVMFILFAIFSIVHSTTIHVPVDTPTIQGGIALSEDGDTIIVAENTYIENINFRGKAIIVASLYILDGNISHIANTIIDGSNPSNPDSGSVVIFESGEDSTSVLYGFTITGGSGTITENNLGNGDIPVRAGGGILCYNSGARIQYNRILNNQIPNYNESAGGGICGYPVGSTALVVIDSNQILKNTVTGTIAYSAGIELTCNGTIKNNDISFNVSNGGANAWGVVGCWTDDSHSSYVLIKDNIISHNKASGLNFAYAGGVSIAVGMNALLIHNKIFNNEASATNTGRGGGIFTSYLQGTVIIDRNRIKNNRANGVSGGGGGISLENNTANSTTIITNNIISGNSAVAGGGIESRNSMAQIINNTIVNNMAKTQGGGIWTSFIKPVVLNTILWNNQAENDVQISGLVDIQYSDVEGGISGTGNIDSDPFFADTLFNLSDSSLCIGSGADSAVINDITYYTPTTDLNGNPRPNPVDIYVDIGAKESGFEIPTGILNNESHTRRKFTLRQNYPNPFNPSTTIRFSLPVGNLVRIDLYNTIGQKVKNILNKKMKAGDHEIEFSAQNLASGVYYYQIQAGEFQDVKKMILLR